MGAGAMPRRAGRSGGVSGRARFLDLHSHFRRTGKICGLKKNLARVRNVISGRMTYTPPCLVSRPWPAGQTVNRGPHLVRRRWKARRLVPGRAARSVRGNDSFADGRRREPAQHGQPGRTAWAGGKQSERALTKMIAAGRLEPRLERVQSAMGLMKFGTVPASRRAKPPATGLRRRPRRNGRQTWAGLPVENSPACPRACAAPSGRQCYFPRARTAACRVTAGCRPGVARCGRALPSCRWAGWLAGDRVVLVEDDPLGGFRARRARRSA